MKKVIQTLDPFVNAHDATLIALQNLLEDVDVVCRNGFKNEAAGEEVAEGLREEVLTLQQRVVDQWAKTEKAMRMLKEAVDSMRRVQHTDKLLERGSRSKAQEESALSISVAVPAAVISELDSWEDDQVTQES
ncbi:hypothetical protein EJ08DRAFT_703755 [Tothia fuscella]|uniref:Uncharacterized protein n=1 Tax=Tothia fuscella TaxID=1048955 RepID=A0A9P4NDS5_9PEZI|nr:hypothetical protein EJ08DRAFT_703755 [Tothia fuscella]